MWAKLRKKQCEAVALRKGGSGAIAERDKEGEIEGTACVSRTIGDKEKMIWPVVCGGEGEGERKSGEEGNMELARADATKRGYEGGEEEENCKRSKKEVIVEDEEVFEIDSRYGEYLYEN